MLTYRHGRCAIHPSLDDDLPSLDDVHTPADGPLDDLPSLVDVPFDDLPSLADDYHGGRGLQPVVCRHTYDTNLLLP